MAGNALKNLPTLFNDRVRVAQASSLASTLVVTPVKPPALTPASYQPVTITSVRPDHLFYIVDLTPIDFFPIK